MLARDQGEAADLIEQHIKTEAPRTVYDALLLPALNYAERDRLEQRLSLDEETAVIDATRELLSDAAELIRRLQPEPSPPDDPALPGPREPLRVLGFATNGVADELALEMLGHLLDDLPIVVEIAKGRMLASELVSLVQAQGVSVVCLADLPPSPPSKTRYLVKRLHAALPEVRILVGRWSPRALADDSTQLLRDAGATLVASTLTETRTYLGGLVEIPRVPVPGPAASRRPDDATVSSGRSFRTSQQHHLQTRIYRCDALTRCPSYHNSETYRPEVTMDVKKLDELSNGLDDLTVTVDELIDESDSMDRKQLDEVHKAIETASDTVDEIDDPE